MLIDRMRLLLLAFLLMAAPTMTSTTVQAQESKSESAAQCDDKNCDCEEGQCEDGECRKKCTDPAETVSVTTVPRKDKPESFESTHKQSKNFRPRIDGMEANLSTFRLREDGAIVA